MNILVLDISASYAFFKIPEGTRSSYSFPFPPKTAIIGLLAGIIGEDRNQYWNDDDKFSNLKIGLQILSDVSTIPIKFNYWRSRSTITVEGYKFVLPGDVKDRGYTTQVKLDFLTDVKYRIFIGIESLTDWEDLVNRLQEKRYYYPPYLGHANLLAEIDFIGYFNSNNITNGNYSTIIPKSALDNDIEVDYSNIGGFKIVYGVPTKYKAEEITVNDYKRWNNSLIKSESFIIPPFSKNLSLSLHEGFGFSINFNNEVVNICLF